MTYEMQVRDPFCNPEIDLGRIYSTW
jgi:hypothetical protein